MPEESKLKGKKVLVTGGSGFIGVNLCLHLRDEMGMEVINLSGNDSPVDFETHKIEMSDYGTLKKFIDSVDFDYVIHLAALSSPSKCPDEETALRGNVKVVENLLKCLEGKKIGKFIFSSTALVYDRNEEMPFTELSKVNPENHFYVKSKLEGERMIKDFSEKTGMPCVIFRISNTYGPYQDWKNDPLLIPHMISDALVKKKIEIRNIYSIRDFLYVGDIVKAFGMALENENCDGLYNLCKGESVSVGEITNYISEKLNVDVEVQSKEKPEKEDKVMMDNTRIIEVLGWKPLVEIREGLDKSIEYYQKTLKQEGII